MMKLITSLLLMGQAFAFAPLRMLGSRSGVHHFMSMKADEVILNKFSRTITEPPKQGASQAMLYATGLNPDTIKLPQVGICSVWFEGNPCNMHLLDLGGEVKKGCKKLV